MEKTKRNWLITGIIAVVMLFGCMLGLGITVQVAYATGPENVAASELQIVLHRNDHSTDSTTFAGGKYLHINPAYETLETNSSSAGADMEYDESTGVLKLYRTDNMSTYNGDLSLYGLNSSDKQLTIEYYYNGFDFYILAFEKGNLTLENVSNSGTHISIGWKNKFKINGELTIRGNTSVYLHLEATGYNYDVNNIIEAGTLKLLGNSSLYYTADSSDDIYSIVYVNSLILNTDGGLSLDAEDATLKNNGKVLYASGVTLTKVKTITLVSPDNNNTTLTNSTYLRNAPTSPIPGYYSAIIQEGNQDDGYHKTYYLISDSTYFTISFNKNRGTGTMAPVQNVNGTFVLPECTFAPPTGYGDLEFQCWSDKTSGGNTYAEGDSYTLVKSITFYARWKIATNHNVSFDANNGTGSMAGGSYLGAYTLPECTITAPSGKQFKCWALGSANATTQFNAGDTYYLHKDVTFYPVWEDAPISRNFTTQPQGVATKEVGQTHQISWAVNFDAVEYAVCFWNGSAWQEMYHYDTAAIDAGTVMNYNITSDVAGEVRYNVDCYYTEFDYITSEEFTITWEDGSREFTSVPSNATKQVGQTFTATWTVNFDTTEYNVLVWDDEWDEYISIYHYDNDTITAGTQMSYNITSDVAGEKRYTIDCYYDYWDYVTSDEFVITWEEAPVNALTGTVTISGTLKYGETLTAVLSGDNNTGTLSYEWRRNGETISGATNSTYTLTQDDIGYTISVVVRSSVESGSLVGTAASIIDKADGPVAPTGITATACTTADNNDGTITGVTTAMEYTADLVNWTDVAGTTITGLNNGTYYVRVKETATHKSSATAPVTVNAYNAPVQYTITVNNGTANTVSATAGTTITLVANAPEEVYEFDKWTGVGVTFSDANSATTTFVMPAGDVTVTATYKLIPVITEPEIEPKPENNGLSAGGIIAIVVGSLAVLGGAGFCVYYFVIRKKKLAK